MARHPGFLLVLARHRRGVSGLDAEELAAVARAQWPTMPDEELEEAVRRAIEYREQTQRRVDPATVNVTHPSRRGSTMPRKVELREFLEAQLEEEPGLSNDRLHTRAEAKYGTVNRRRLGQLARQIRKELEAGAPASNGAKRPNPGRPQPEPPKAPSADDAESDPAPTTESVEGNGRAPVRRAELRTDRHQIDADPGTGEARLFIDARVPVVLAYRLMADVLEAQALAAEEARDA